MKKYDKKINKIKFKIQKNFKILSYLVSAEFKKKGCRVSILTTKSCLFNYQKRYIGDKIEYETKAIQTPTKKNGMIY